MADETTSSRKPSSAKAEASADVKEQDVLIPVDTSLPESREGTDHNAEVNKHLDAAAKAMVKSGMSESDAEAFLNSARPRGVSTAVGNYADLQRMTGLPTVEAEDPDTSRLHLAAKIPKEEG
jgi:hypothetical protein